PICEGDNLAELPVTSNNGIAGTWSPAINNTETTAYTFTPADGLCATEVILTIEVIPIEVPDFDAVAPICPGQFLDDLPTTSNNGFTGVWTPDLNTMVTTTYTFTPDPGQGCTTSTTLEIVVTEPITPTFDAVNSICEGEELDELPTISNEGITGTWSPALNNLETTTYTFTSGAGQCAVETVELQIQVIPISELSIEVELISEPFSDNQTVVATVTGGTGVYEYQLDGGLWLEENTFSGVTGCEEHIIRARETSGCSNIASGTFRILEYPKFFTPNGDTFNDIWNIDCLRDQVGAKVTIFDRYGKILTVIDPSRFGWDGTYNDARMPSNDYWFKAEYFDENGSSRVFTSHFALKR
ncbi:MAG: T9SS type B sorting domain-containing protein, partial [Bacteroidota bacterium]